MKLSIIIPIFNEEKTLAAIIQRIQAVSYPIEHEIILIDDASVDESYQKAILLKAEGKKGNHAIRLFKNEVNAGKGFSVRKGIRHSLGDILVIQDADIEYDPFDLSKLLEPILAGRADAVFGSRFLNTPYPRGMAFPNWLANQILTKLANLLYGIHLTDAYTCYKVCKADLLKEADLRSTRFELEAEITAVLALRKARIVERPIHYHPRTSTEGKKIKARDFFQGVWTLLRRRFGGTAYECPLQK